MKATQRERDTVSKLTGIQTAAHLAAFLGKKIAIKRTENEYDLYPTLYAIYADRHVHVMDKEGHIEIFSWDVVENPYILLETNKGITIK